MPPSSLPFLDVMHTYFRGERIESLYFLVPFGLACLTMAGVALKAERGGFGWGLAVPFVLLGLLALGVGGGVGLRTPAQVAQIEAAYNADPAAMLREELPRMEKVNNNWSLYLGAYAVALVVGAGLRFGLRADWAHGLGIGLVFFGASGLIIDGFAERRAKVYTEALEALSRQQG